MTMTMTKPGYNSTSWSKPAPTCSGEAWLGLLVEELVLESEVTMDKAPWCIELAEQVVGFVVAGVVVENLQVIRKAPWILLCFGHPLCSYTLHESQSCCRRKKQSRS